MRFSIACSLAGLAVISACGRSSSPPDAFAYHFSLSGAVADSLVPVQPPIRVVVGVAKVSDVPQKVYCSRFLVKYDQVAQSLPASYSLNGVPEGSYLLVALLLDGKGAAMAPATTYDINVDAQGVHRGTGPSTSTIDIAIQGTMAYDCP